MIPIGQRRIGATDAPAILGVDPWSGPEDVFNRLALGSDKPQNDLMRRGLKVEPEIRRLAVERYELELVPRDYEKKFIFRSDEHEFATATPDDFARRHGRDGVLELKSANRFSSGKYGPEGTDQVRENYLVQCHWLMAVTGRFPAWMVVAFGDDDKATKDFVIAWTALYIIEPDLELQAWMLGIGERFWNEHVKTGVVPSKTWWQAKEAA